MKEIFHVTGKHPSDVDIAVLLLFFRRTDITVRTFDQIRRARPSRLYLYQDGPRSGRQDDVENIATCRKVIEDMIDWNCEVHKFYQENNFGCDPSEYISQKWMFETEEKGIIIEDDDVMSVSFFRFCKVLLDKYENDTRINIICGMNHLGVYEDCPYDYFFSHSGGSIWGWATWRRVVEQWDPSYAVLKDSYFKNILREKFGKDFCDSWFKVCERHKVSKREHYESILGLAAFQSGAYNIVPKKNMTCNIGASPDATHCASDIKQLPRKVRQQLNMETYELEFPLKHPNFVVDDLIYKKRFDNIVRGTKLERTLRLRSVERLLYRVFPIFAK